MSRYFAALLGLLGLGFTGVALAGPPTARSLAGPSVPPCFQQVTSPNPSVYINTLNSVAAVAANDVWAVGYSSNGNNVYQTLVEHWDGTNWFIVPSPNPGSAANRLRGVAVVGTNDVWAVGDYYNSSSGQTLVEHWNGSAWSVVTSPNPSATYNLLHSVAVVGTNDVWAIGEYLNSGNVQTLTEHWSGSAWTVVPSPNPGTGHNILHGVAAVGAGDVWAVGEYYNGIGQTLTEHWDGTNWSIVPSPNPGSADNLLDSVAVINSSDIWAVGYSSNGSNVAQTLILHSCPPPPTTTPTSTPTDTPTATSTPPATTTATTTPPNTPTDTPTDTPVPPPTNTVPAPTSTPGGPSPTPCIINFSDVQPTDYFYPPVLDLACRGVISGYADSTFRPYNTTTRGQMVKIVVLGFNKPISTPVGSNYTFSDVPTTFPFFAYIETAAALNIVSGYVCGQPPAGPCDAQNRPYFLPYNYVTRGQLSKIDVGAAGWTLLHPATGIFEDVPPGTTFYPFVETAAARNVVSGYACGVPPAGACVPPANRPDFLPGNLATRGQISKIVDLSILSGP